MIWLRFIMIGMFSATALSLISYQGIEIMHAFMDYFKQK